jgi:hypothetical protein
MSVVRKHKVLIYKLKRTFGDKATFFRLRTNTNNVRTGVIAREYDSYTIWKAIILPAILDRSFVYDLAYIASNKNFTTGGYFDRTKRAIMIDAADLPKDFQPRVKDHVEFEDERYELVTIERHAKNSIYLLSCQALSNSEKVGEDAC